MNRKKPFASPFDRPKLQPGYVDFNFNPHVDEGPKSNGKIVRRRVNRRKPNVHNSHAMPIGGQSTLRSMLMKKVLEIVASRRGVLLTNLTNGSKETDVTEGRMIAVGVLKELGYSRAAISRAINCESLRTVNYLERRRKEMMSDQFFKHDFDYVLAHFENECVCPTCLRALSEREVIELYVATHPNPKSNGTH